MGYLCQCRISSPFFYVLALFTARCLTNWVAKAGASPDTTDDMRERFMARTNKEDQNEWRKLM